MGETIYAVECPQCSYRDHADASWHYRFAEDKLALRCRKCYHIWEVGRDFPIRLVEPVSGVQANV